MRLRCARFADLDPATLYAILKLRVDVFVVEQHCAYPELDGRDTEPDAWHCWVEKDGQIQAYLRVLVEEDGWARIGRVVTSPSARRRGVAASLIRQGLELAGDRPVVIYAQARLSDWYAGFGFEPVGSVFMEDGLPHWRMVRRP
jgi:ElaA protein